MKGIDHVPSCPKEMPELCCVVAVRVVCVQILIPTGSIGAVVSLTCSCPIHLMMRRILVGDAAAVKEAEQQGVFMGAAPSIFVASFPALAHVWATHLGLWGFLDPIWTWALYVIPTFGILALVVYVIVLKIIPKYPGAVGMLACVCYSWDTILSNIMSVRDTLLTVLQIAHVFGLSLVAPSGPLHFLVLHDSVLRGVLAGILQAVLIVLRVLTMPLLFVAWPVTAPLGFVASFLKAFAVFAVGLALDGFWELAMNVCIYMMVYVVPLPVLQDMVGWECESPSSGSPGSSAMRICQTLQLLLDGKILSRQQPDNSWWFDLILLLWFWFVALKLQSCMRRTGMRNRGEREPISGAEIVAEMERRQLSDEARQRKEPKAAQRKQQKQRGRGR